MANSTQDDLIILDDSVTDLDADTSKEEATSEVNFDDITSNNENVVLENIEEDEVKTEESNDLDIDLSDLEVEENKNTDTSDSLIIEDSNEDLMNLSKMDTLEDENNFDLDLVTEKFVSQLNNRKDQISSLIENNQSSIKEIDDEIKEKEKNKKEINSKINSLKEEDDKIDSRITLLTGDSKTSYNKTRKKAA